MTLRDAAKGVLGLLGYANEIFPEISAGTGWRNFRPCLWTPDLQGPERDPDQGGLHPSFSITL